MFAEAERIAQLLVILFFPAMTGNDAADFLDNDSFWARHRVAVTSEAMREQLVRPEPAEIGHLLNDLGSPHFHARQRAMQRIRQLGPGAMEGLRRAADSHDPEIAFRAQRLVEYFEDRTTTTRVRRLMALKTLHHLEGDRCALLLRTVADDPHPMDVVEAEYARLLLMRQAPGAAASQAGARVSDETLLSDVWLLPASCGMVGQTTPWRQIPFSADELVRVGTSFGGVFGDSPSEATLRTHWAGMAPRIEDLISTVGYARLDAVTLGVSKDVGPGGGYCVIVGRGFYDRDRAGELLVGCGLDKRLEHGVPTYWADDEAVFLMPDHQRLVFAAGSQGQIPMRDLIEACRRGKGTLGENAAMARLVKSADRRHCVWAAAELPTAFTEVPFVNGLTEATAFADWDSDGVKATAVVRGKDEGAILAALTAMDGVLLVGRGEMKRQAESTPMIRPFYEAMKTIKHTRDGDTATITAQYAGPATDILWLPSAAMLQLNDL